MKMIIALSALLAVALAAPQQRGGPEKDAVILKFNSNNIGTDGYDFEYETSNQIAQREVAQLLNAGTDNEELSVQGEYSYPGPNGVLYVVKYIANKDGFQPIGDHIPK